MVASHSDEKESLELLARSIFYELDLLNFPSAVLGAIRQPSRGCLRTLFACNHVWLRAVEGHCGRGRGGTWMVGKARSGGQLLDEYEKTEREFRFTALLIVRNFPGNTYLTV